MLIEVYCQKFKNKRITFKKGLNVVLGSNTGENSIGKSTFLLIIDYIFGGSTYSNCYDVLNNVGDHDINFTFLFEEKKYYFCRNSNEPKFVWKCDNKYKKLEKIDLKTYCNWLSNKYGIESTKMSFRDCVGRYSRVYGKQNCNEKKPLHYSQNESNDKATTSILKLFNKYEKIKKLEEIYKESEETLKIYNQATKKGFVSSVTKKEFDKNKKRIEDIDKEIKLISDDIDANLFDVDTIKTEEAIYLKDSLFKNRKIRRNLISRKDKLTENLEYKFSKTTEDFSELNTYFPQVNIKKIKEIEEFHFQISKIFKDELMREKKDIIREIEICDENIKEYNHMLTNLIKNPKISKTILNRHAEYLLERKTCEVYNESYIKKNKLNEEKIKYKKDFVDQKQQCLREVSDLINEEMKRINYYICEGKYNSPVINFTEKNYDFFTPDDTGTGMSYKGLIIFDLAVLNLTVLPILIHDSVILKQISDDAIEKIIDLYTKCGKQIFIAFDKQDSYTDRAIRILNENSILKLNRGGFELFGKSWG